MIELTFVSVGALSPVDWVHRAEGSGCTCVPTGRMENEYVAAGRPADLLDMIVQNGWLMQALNYYKAEVPA